MSATRHVLITDAGRGSALACIRSLGRTGWTVTAADHDRSSPGFRSRYVTHRVVLPDPLLDADATVERIHEVVRTTGVDLVIPVTDDVGLPIAAARDRFAGLAALAIPEPAALDLARDKMATVELAGRLDIAVPPTVILRERDGAEAAAASLGYPIVVKPAMSRDVRPDGSVRRFNVSYAGDPAELSRRLAAIDRDMPVLLQAWLPGEGVGVELLMDRGHAVAAFQHRRLREVPVTGGASALRAGEVPDPELLDRSCRLLAAMGWTGLAMVEYRRAPDGSSQLMEVNGRIWGSLPLAVRSGMDFPVRWADLVMGADGGVGARPPMSVDYRAGVQARNLRLDLAWIRGVLLGRGRVPYLPWPSRGAALRALASLADPRIKDDLFTLRDPGPGLAQWPAIVRDAVGGKRAEGG